MRIVIVGAVALGASAATRLKRLNPSYEVILLEKGNYASFANCGLPYFLSDVIDSKDKLLVTNKSVFIDRFKIDLRTSSEVTKIQPRLNKVEVTNHEMNEKYSLDYDYLILAMGADAIKPKIEGIEENGIYYLKTIDDAINLKSSLKNKKKICIVGGGFIGLEAMENIVEMGKNVTLIEGRKSVSNLDYDMAHIAHKIIIDHGVDLKLNTIVNKIIKLKEDSFNVETNNGIINCDAILMSVGIKPNVKLAKDAGIKLDKNNTIKVNNYLQTNFKNIYAGGDLVSNFDSISNNLVYVPLANYANKHGRIIANNIHFGNKEKRQKITMASVFKLFDYTVASVGLNENMCDKFDLQTLSLHQCANSHASYYPGSTPIYSKIRFDKNGKIYGGQFVGKNLVEKRVDALSAYLLKGCNYHDLMQNESSYAPPFNAAKDILNMFGFMIDNVLNNNLKTISPLELKKIENEAFIVDVRPKELYKKGHIGNSINIPIDTLRDNIDKLPKDRTIYFNCMMGLTSYNAICMLKNYNLDIVNVSGGYNLYKFM